MPRGLSFAPLAAASLLARYFLNSIRELADLSAFRSDASLAKLPARLQRTFERVAKAGKDGLGLDKLDRDGRWDARILVKLGAIRAVAAEKPAAKPRARKAAAKQATPLASVA